MCSLTERATQNSFRAHIDQKLDKLERELPEGGSPAQQAKRRAELSTILLDFREHPQQLISCLETILTSQPPQANSVKG